MIFMLYYYKNNDGVCSARSFPLDIDGEREISESEYAEYTQKENKKHETE